MSKPRVVVIHSCLNDCPHFCYDDNCHIIGYHSCYRCLMTDKEIPYATADKEVPDWCMLKVYEDE